jgi:predicted small metal-binding protein
MAERLECIVDGCTAVIEADSEDEVMAKAEEHAESSHPDLELDEETIESIRSNIKTV